jgi:two-component system KDP operon response regulator KdpE
MRCPAFGDLLEDTATAGALVALVGEAAWASARFPRSSRVTARILVVEDEPQILRALSALLRAEGYEPEGTGTVAGALKAALLRPPDAVLLDLLLPDGHGLEVCRGLREWSQAPIVVVSAVGDQSEKIAALDAGADDYITKPYPPGELLARLRAALRRTAAGEAATLRFADVEIDLERREVRRGGEPVPLSVHEYAVLAELARHPDRVLTHRALLLAVWGPGAVEQTHYLRVYMGRLRRKLERDPVRPCHLLTETGVGYRLRREGAATSSTEST